MPGIVAGPRRSRASALTHSISRRAALGIAASLPFGRGTKARRAGPINASDAGAAGDFSRDDAPALRKAFAACVAERRPLHLPAGHYRLDSALVWDLGDLARTGIAVSGDGAQLTMLDFVRGSDRPDLLLTSTVAANFYSRLSDFGVRGRGRGAVLQIGDDTCADVHNSCSIERLVINADGGGCPLVLNAVCAGHIDAVANGTGSGLGIATHLRQAQFCSFTGSQGNAAVGTQIDVGYNFGNVFTSVDYEALGTAVRVDGVHCTHNTWIGGTIANARWGFDCSAGSANRVINLNPGIPLDRMVRHAVGLLL